MSAEPGNAWYYRESHGLMAELFDAIQKYCADVFAEHPDANLELLSYVAARGVVEQFDRRLKREGRERLIEEANEVVQQMADNMERR